MWLIAPYEPVTLFTLKSGLATATGAKTLLVPTPFAIRTALLDIAIRVEGVEHGPDAFSLISKLDICLSLPAYASVTNLFAKILKPTRSDKEKAEAMQQTIAFREYVHWQGMLALGFGEEATVLDRIAEWLPHLNYLGRRGGFIQLKPPLEYIENDVVPDKFTSLTRSAVDQNGKTVSDQFPLGLMQMVDDWGPTLTYEKANVFDEATISRPGTGQDRLRYGVVVPYQFRRAGRSYTLYERI
jgi:hypothetical protein